MRILSATHETFTTDAGHAGSSEMRRDRLLREEIEDLKAVGALLSDDVLAFFFD